MPFKLAGCNCFHVLFVVWGSLEILLFGGVIFGWHSLVYVYKEEGYFRNLCPSTNSTSVPTFYRNQTLEYRGNTTVEYESGVTTLSHNVTDPNPPRSSADDESYVCKPQDKQLHLIFALATGITGLMSALNGVMYDRFGTRFCRTIAIICHLAGMLCFIFASPAEPLWLYPGAVLIVYGGYMILITNLQLAGLIPRLRSTLMSLYAGSYDSSAVIFLLFKQATYGEGISSNTCFSIQTSLFVIVIISTFFTLPRHRLPWILPKDFKMEPSIYKRFCKKDKFRIRANTSESYKLQEFDIHEHGKKDDEYITNSNADNFHDISLEEKSEDICNKDVIMNENFKPFDNTSNRVVFKSMTNKSSNPDDEHFHSDENVTDETIHNKESGERCHGNSDNENGDTTDRHLESSGLIPQNVTNGKEADSKKELENPLHRKSIGSASTEVKPPKTYLQEVLSPLFIWDLMWMCFQRLRSWFFIGTFNSWITHMAGGNLNLVSHYTSVFSFMQLFGIFTAPLSGFLMDRQLQAAQIYHNKKYERLHASITSFALNSGISVLLSIGAALPVLEVQYVTFFLHTLNRSFIYGPNSAFVANAFPSQHFGKLLGVSLTVSAIFGMLQFPLFVWVQGPLNNDPTTVNILFIVLMALSFIHPMYIWIYLRRKRRKYYKKVETSEL